MEKSHILAINALIKIDVPEGQTLVASESKARLKRGRPVDSRDKNPRKIKREKINDGQIDEAMTLKGSPEEILDMNEVQEKSHVPDNEEISTNYVMSRIKWNQNQIDIADIFACNVALEILNDNVDHEPISIEECRRRDDWPKWKESIGAELKSLVKRDVFGHVVYTPEGVNLWNINGFL